VKAAQGSKRKAYGKSKTKIKVREVVENWCWKFVKRERAIERK